MNDVSGDRRRRCWLRLRCTGLLTIVAGAGVLTAGCGGGASGTPHVASLGHTSSAPGTPGSSSATAEPTGTPTRLLDEWAACMRRHGDTGQTDPTVDANKVIHISISPSVRGGDSGTTGQNGTGGPGTYCLTLLTKAANDLSRGYSVKTPDQAALNRFSACVRANGIPDFPDLRASGNGMVMQLNGRDLRPNNPALQRAEKLCGQKTGVQGMPGEGAPPPGTIVDDGAGGGPGANG